MAKGDKLHPLQQKFIEHAALQCGICTPGLLVAAKALLEKNPNPTENEMRFWLAGNLCRCTGYDKIVRAVMSAAAEMRETLTHAARYQTRRPAQFKVVGTRPLRPDGLDKVTGRAKFGADATVPGMLIGKVLRSPHPHARIRSIDVRRRRSCRASRRSSPATISRSRARSARCLRNVMAREKALYDGHAVAAVAATSASIARKALRLIKVDYEILPHVTDVDEAMSPARRSCITTSSRRLEGEACRGAEGRGC